MPRQEDKYMSAQQDDDGVTAYRQALKTLAAAGVFKENDAFRDGHIAAEFAPSSVDFTGSTLTQRVVTEDGRAEMLGQLFAAAAARGLKPVELLAIGMAAVLRG
jgi:hypothetical protein